MTTVVGGGQQSGTSDGGMSFESMFPWSPAEGQIQPEGYFHAKAALADGRPAALMDTGAFANIGGGNNVRAQAELAKKFGHATHQRRFKQLLYVSGLGNGVKKAEWEVNLPVATENKDGSASVHRLVVPCLENIPQDPNDKSADLKAAKA